MTRKLVSLIFLIALLIPSGCSTGTTQTGILEGKVTIGPIWPVEPPGGPPPIPPEVYRARKIMVYDRIGTRLVKQVDISDTGFYRVELKPGIYTIDINRIGIDSSPDVPQKVEIKPGQTIRLDIDIDTGIR